MHRPGSDPDAMTAEDFLCDFCERSWSEETPFVEGHQGSCICGDCLREAIRAKAPPAPPATPKCTMCLETRDEAGWASPRRDAWICTRCIEQATRVLSKDRSAGWTL